MRASLALLALLLAGCASREDRLAEWNAHCVPTFTSPQCAFLFAMAEDTEDAARGAALATGLALGSSSRPIGGK